MSSVNALTLDAVSVHINTDSILENVSLTLQRGQAIGIMGPNGSGKSSLAYALAGHPAYELVNGSASLFGHELVTMTHAERAKLGLFVVFQQTCAFENVSALSFLHEAYRSLKDETISYKEMELLVLSWLSVVGLDSQLLYRPLYAGFSGGQKKRFELLQLLLFRPSCAILDEIDAGMDAQGMEILISVLNTMRSENNQFTLIVISHNAQFLKSLALGALYCVHNKTLNS